MRIKYLCLLGHKKYPELKKYDRWQKRIIKKYNLWSFSTIEEYQIEEEIKNFEAGK